MLLFIRSKIQFFESKSQPACSTAPPPRCCLSDQRYNFLKANHNKVRWNTTAYGLFIRSKIQFFESKSQLFTRRVPACIRCLSDQRYNFLKANHNYALASSFNTRVVYQIKDTIFWKQITTYKFSFIGSNGLFIRSKIQFFESKSQPSGSGGSVGGGCLSDQRYNFLKANHNA